MNLGRASPNDFDGSLVVVVDKFLTKESTERMGSDGKILFKERNQHHFEQVDFPPLHALALKGCYEKLYKKSQLPIFEELSGQFQAELEKIIAESSKEIERVLRIICAGSLKVSYLLRTLGGYPALVYDLKNLTEHFRRNNGRISAFGDREVASAGGEIFMLADRKKRYATPGTKLFFHTGEPPAIIDTDAQKLLDQDWEKLKRKLICNTRKSVQKEIIALLREAENQSSTKPDRPVEITAERAQHFGMAHIPSRGIERQFRRTHNVDFSSYKNTALDRFFARERTERQDRWFASIFGGI